MTTPSSHRFRVAVAGPGLALAGGWGACALALPEGRRPALLAAGLGAAVLLVAVVTAWRVLGTAALALAALAPLLAGALEPAAARPSRLLLASVLLLMLVAGLDGVGRDRTGGPVVLARSLVPGRRRWVPPVAALGGGVVVALIASAPAVPSVVLVLCGLVAATGALLLATRLHRTPRALPGTSTYSDSSDPRSV